MPQVSNDLITQLQADDNTVGYAVVRVELGADIRNFAPDEVQPKVAELLGIDRDIVFGVINPGGIAAWLAYSMRNERAHERGEKTTSFYIPHEKP